MNKQAAHWPYPRWVAHRGAGKLAPENTLAAMRVGASYGYRMFECDVKLSSDGVPFLLHDATLERTSNGQGNASALPWSALSQLDAGSWHGPGYAGEPLPSLQAVARYCRANHYLLNIEIKPSPGNERATGEVVARAAAALWADAAVPPLLTSFSTESLRAAQASAAHLPRGLLLDALGPDWLAQAQALGCVAVVFKQLLCDANTLARARSAGLHTLCYTVNDASAAQGLLALGLEGIITDRVDLFSPASF